MSLVSRILHFVAAVHILSLFLWKETFRSGCDLDWVWHQSQHPLVIPCYRGRLLGVQQNMSAYVKWDREGWLDRRPIYSLNFLFIMDQWVHWECTELSILAKEDFIEEQFAQQAVAPKGLPWVGGNPLLWSLAGWSGTSRCGFLWLT